jgi:hypothetical protein
MPFQGLINWFTATNLGFRTEAELIQGNGRTDATFPRIPESK